jgi:hypothetical protein
MASDPSTGPIPKDKFMELVDAPFGEARKVIQKHDPQWGRAEGEKFRWVCEVQRTAGDGGKAYVMAASQEEADDLADDLSESDIHWDSWADDFEIISVRPAGAND